MLTGRKSLPPAAKVRLWIAQQHKHPRSQRAPSDIALTEPDRDMSAVKLVKWCR